MAATPATPPGRPEDLPPGLAWLEPGARAEAVAETLPLLATYFVSGDSWDVASQQAVTEAHELDSTLAAAVRLRVLLALAEELAPILHTITLHPTFRYAQEATDSVGLIAGRLDVQRYVQRRGRRTAPRRYPIRVVQRDVATPENVLAVAALQGIIRSLGHIPQRVLPAGPSPERKKLASVRSSLVRFEQLPLFADLTRRALRSGAGTPLAKRRADVLRRIQRGDIVQPGAYQTLADWVGDFVAGTAAAPGLREWAFYDARFDPRLFEIWTLWTLTRCLRARYGEPTGGTLSAMSSDGTDPFATWNTAYGVVDLFFQREMNALGVPGRWRITSRDQRLRAIPDITLRVTPVGEAPRWLVLDCKLRRRQPLPAANDTTSTLDAPTEEIYKMLGYFEHLMSGAQPVGALVYYTPGGNKALLLDAPEPVERVGALTIAGVDPAAPGDAAQAICAIADSVASLLREPGDEAKQQASEAAEAARSAGADEDEAAVAYKQQLLLRVLQDHAKQHEDQLPAVQKLTQAWFPGGVWDALDQDTRRMVLSAELYGSQQLPALDHSGPLLVMCAACERELNRRLFQGVRDEFPNETTPNGEHVIHSRLTLGAALEILHRGRQVAIARADANADAEQAVIDKVNDPNLARAVAVTADYLRQEGTDRPRLSRLVKALRSLNFKYRIPAAHDEVVEADLWGEGRGRVLGHEGALAEIVAVFPRART